ncbi:MAG: tripartite tricarboxylate transporter substrate binding protein [Pseudomonadota bacterium]
MKLLIAIAVGLTTLAIGSNAIAQSYPTKPIRVVVPFPPGGGADVLARPLAPKLTEIIGQQIVIDNRPGANANIVAEHVARAAADGYTLFFGNSSLTISMSLYSKLPFDAVKDFTPVSLLSVSPSVLVLHPSIPAKSVQELIALAKARPGKLNYGSAGIGNTMHLAGALFSTMAGVKMVHVPFKGAGPAIIDLIGGQLELVFVNIPPVISHVRAGKLKAIGVTTKQRASVLPDVPTISESGLTGYEVTTWFGILGPAGLPKEIVARLNGAIVSAMGARDLRERFTELGSEPGTSSPEHFGDFIRNDITSWAKVVKISGATAD